MKKIKIIKKDILIVGGGPVGIFASFQAGLLGMSSVIAESLSEMGGQCSHLYPEKYIYDIPSVPKIKAKDLILNLLEQASRFSPMHINSVHIKSVNNQDNSCITTLSNDQIIESKAVIFATGAGKMDPIKVNLPNIENLQNNKILYSVKDRSVFKDKNILIIGGGDSAADWAMDLAGDCKSLNMFLRRDKFRCHQDSENKIKQLEATIESFNIHYNASITNIQQNQGEIVNASFAVKNSDDLHFQNIDYIIAFLGLKHDMLFAKSMDVDARNGKILVKQSTMESSREMIYCIGDGAMYENKLKLIMSGFAEAATALYDIYKKHNSKSFNTHSSDLFQ